MTLNQIGGTFDRKKFSGVYNLEESSLLKQSIGLLNNYQFDKQTPKWWGSAAVNQEAFCFSADGTKAYLLSTDTDRIYQYTALIPFDPSSLVEEFTSIQLNDVTGTPTSFVYSPDGLRMYVCDSSKIYQYTLGVANDFATLAYVKSANLQAGRSTRQITIDSTGTKLFASTLTDNWIDSYDFGTAWDVATLTYNTTNRFRNVPTGSSNTIQDVTFNPSGTKMYMLTTENRYAVQYNLSSAYDLTTASNSVDILDDNSLLAAVVYGNNGQFVYCMNSFGSINQWSLATAYRISPATLSVTATSVLQFTGGPASGFVDLKFSSDGTKAYALNTDRFIYQYTLGTAWDISTISYANKRHNLSLSMLTLTGAGSESLPTSITFKPDGTAMFVLGTANDFVYEYILDTAWDVSTARWGTELSSVTVSAQDTIPTDVTFSSDGTRMYVVGDTNNTLYQYSLATPWDVKTASYASKTLSLSQDTSPVAFRFNNDGTIGYMLGDLGNSVFQYTFSTAWEINTGSYANKTFSVGSQEVTPNGLAFGDSGTKMYVVGTTGDRVYQYNLTTAWDIATASYSNLSLLISVAETNTTSLAFSSDGTKVFVAGTSLDTIRQYNLSTAWNISTGVLQAGSVSTSLDGAASGIDFSSDGTRVYYVGTTQARVFQVYLSTPWSISTSANRRLALSGTSTTVEKIEFDPTGLFLYLLQRGPIIGTISRITLGTAWTVLSGFSGLISRNVGAWLSITPTPAGLAITPDGTRLLFGTNRGYAASLEMTTPWNVGTLKIESLSISGNATAIGFNSNGTVFHSNDGTSDFYSSTCTVAYDLETATYNSASQNANALPGNNGTASFFDFYINANGNKLQTLSSSNKLLIQYDRIGTNVFIGSFSVLAQNTLMTAMCVNFSGTSFYLSSASVIYQYKLTTPFDIRTISFFGSYSTAAFDTAIKAIDILPSDDRVYVAGDTTDVISELRMTVPDNITTMYYIDNSPVITQDTAPQDVQFSADGSSMYILGGTNATIYQYTCSVPFDAKTAVYANKLFSLTSIDSSILNFNIDPSGQFGFVLTGTSLRVNQFRLATAWDISTAYVIRSASFSAQITSSAHPEFGDNGTKLYIAFQGSTTSTVYQYDLTVPYDITTRVYTNKSFVTADTQISGIRLNPTGTRLFLLGDAANRVYQFTLDIPWDISSRRTYKTYSIGTQEATLQQVTFKPDGTKMYAIGWTNDRIYQYTLSTPYDVSTAAYDNKSFALQGGQTGPSAIYFKDDGLRVYVWDIDVDRAIEYRLTTAWDISTAYWIKNKQASSVNALNGSANGFTFKPDGLRLYMLDAADDFVYQYNLTTAWDINSMVYSSKFCNISGFTEADPRGVEFSSDGRYLYIVGNTNDRVYQLECDTYWDVSTARHPYRTFSISGALGATNWVMTGGAFSSDGTRFYVVSQMDDAIYQFSLSTAWDISTMSYANKTFSIVNRETNATAIDISTDGTKVYILGTIGDTVIQFDLTTAYDISTAVHNGKFKSVSAQDSTPHAFRISSDGTKAAMLGQFNNTIYYYTLSTAWDISTMTYTGQSSSVAAQESASTGLSYIPAASGSTEGTGWYVVGTNSDRIYRFASSTPFSSTGFAVITNSGNFSFINTNVTDVMVSPDGNWAYLLGTNAAGADLIYQIPLLTSYDPSTANIGSFGVGTEETTPEKVRFSDNGTRMYVMGQAGDDVNKYRLFTPWLVSSAGLLGTSGSITDTVPQGLFVNSDGSQVYTIGNNDLIRRWATSGTNGTLFAANGTASIVPLVGAFDAFDVFFSSDGLKMYVLMQSTVIYEFDVDEAFNIYSVNTQWSANTDTAVRAAAWSSDGLKCFTAGDTGNAIFVQNASFAWNLSSLVGASNFIDLGLNESTPRGLYLKSDGSKLYLTGEALDSIREYNMTNYASPSLASEISIANEYPNPLGLTLSSDGLNAYFTSSNSVFQIALDTAWNISTAFVASASIPEDTVPIGMFIGDSGTKLFTMGRTNDSMRTYTLAAPWNVGKPVSLREYTGTTAEGLPAGFAWNPTGTKFFTVGQGLDEIREYTVTTPWNTTTASYSSKRIECLRTTPVITDPFGFTISDDGTKIITMSGATMYSLELTTAYDLNSFTHGGLLVSGQDGTPRALCFNGSGTRMYMAGNTNDTIIQYNLGSAFRMTTCVAANISRTITGADTTVRGIDCNPDATKFYVIGTVNNRINEFTNSLSSGELGTLTLSGSSISTLAYETTITGLSLTDSGTKLCIVGSGSDRVFQFHLTTANTISSWDPRRLSIATQEPNVRGIAFSPDGDELFVYGTSGSIFQYNIAPSRNISFSSYSGKFFYAGTLVGGSGTPIDISFSHDGRYFYLLDGQTNASAFVQRYGLLGF